MYSIVSAAQIQLIKTNVVSLICFSTKTKQLTLVFEWLKAKQIITNILFGFITKTKKWRQFLLVKTKQVKTQETSTLSTKTKQM